METKCLAVEAAMTQALREVALRRVVERDPRMDGAKVADVIDLYADGDHFITRTEPWWSEHGEALCDEIEHGVSEACSGAIVAACLLTDEGDEEMVVIAEALARAAAEGEIDVVDIDVLPVTADA